MSPLAEYVQIFVQVFISLGIFGVGYFVTRIDKTLITLSSELKEAVAQIGTNTTDIEWLKKGKKA